MHSEVVKTKKGAILDGLLLFTPTKYEDDRGFFYESWNKNIFDRNTKKNINFVQDNHSKSKKGVLRGLHYQIEPFAQGKLIKCIRGEIFDVAVDIRKSSKTFGKWVGINLSEKNMKQFWIPKGFAHGFLTMSNDAEVFYKATNFWDKSSERSLRWNDQELLIEWPLFKFRKDFTPIISRKDSEANSLKDNINSSQIFL